MEKTKVMLITNNIDLSIEFNRASVRVGFKLVTEIDLLGFTVYPRGSEIVKNWSKIVKTIKDKINVWKIYNLSINGRITVSKTHLISQIQYFGSILNIPDNILIEMEGLIENYVQGGGRKYAKQKLYSKIENGGLDLISIKEYCIALKCGLIKHTNKFCDWWGVILREKCLFGNDLENITPDNLNPNVTPIIHSLASALRLVNNSFIMQDGNIRNAKVYNNDLFRKINNRKITQIGNIFNWNLSKPTLINSRLNNFLIPGTSNPIDIITLNNSLNTNFGVLEYMEIRSWIFIATRNYRLNLDLKSHSFISFFNFPLKGCKKFRKILQYDEIQANKNNFPKYIEGKLGVAISNRSLKFFYKCWKYNFIDYDLSTFIFNFSNNKIYTNDRLSHFLNVQDSCPLCISTNTQPPGRDSLIHAFSTCKEVNILWIKYFKKTKLTSVLNDTNLTRLLSFEHDCNNLQLVVNIELFLVRYFIKRIRDYKLKTINFGSLEMSLSNYRYIMSICSNRYKKSLIFVTNVYHVNLDKREN